MLKLAEEKDIEAIKSLCANNIPGIRILCYINSYGFDRNFLEIWLNREDSKPNAVIAKFFDDITLVSENKADYEQISVFLNMSGYNSICADYEICRKLGFEKITVKNGYKFIGASEGYVSESLTESDFSEAYKLISREIPGSFSNDRDSYLSFLSDFTFRERRGFARGVCTHTDGHISSVALTSSETYDNAIISGVACDSQFKKKGLGKLTVLSLVELLRKENKSAYVIALNESAEGFYEHIGFEKIEKIGFIERDSYV